MTGAIRLRPLYDFVASTEKNLSLTLQMYGGEGSETPGGDCPQYHCRVKIPVLPLPASSQLERLSAA